MENKEITTNDILLRLAKIQADMDFVKEHIEEVSLTEDDIKSLEDAEEDYRKGRTRRL